MYPRGLGGMAPAGVLSLFVGSSVLEMCPCGSRGVSPSSPSGVITDKRGLGGNLGDGGVGRMGFGGIVD